MFRLFNQARHVALSKGKTMQFLRYALGEIILVVIGILIALQINNWNEERIEQDQIREYALNLADAIERDLEMLSPVEMQIRASIRQAEEFAHYVRGRGLEDFDNADLFFLTTHIGYRPYAWNRAALEQLKSAGGLRKMRDQRLVQAISGYDALTQHLDQDYREDEDSARAMLDAIHRLVDLNYELPGLEEVITWPDGFTQEDIERRLTRFRESGVYERMASEGRPFLSSNIVDYQQLANMNLEYAGSAEARPEIELPRLRTLAAEILALIDEEYR